MPKFNTPQLRHQKSKGGLDRAYVILSGERIYLGNWRTPEVQETFNRTVAEWYARGCTPVIPTDTATVIECVAVYVAYAETYFKSNPQSFDAVKVALRPLVALYGRTLASKFGSVQLRVIQTDMIKHKWSITTINRRINVIRRLWKHCASLGMVPADVWNSCATLGSLKAGRCAAPPPKKIMPVSHEHVQAIELHVTRSVWGLVNLQMLTGARSGEILTLKASDIDMSAEVWTVEITQHKNSWRGQTRTLFLGPQAQTLLRPFLLRRGKNEYLFQPKDFFKERSEAAPTHRRPTQKPNPPKTDRTCGNCYTVESYCRAVHRACAKAGIPQWNPHRLRHSAATLVRKEYGLEASKAVLGHSSLDATQVYAERDAEVARKVASEIG